MNLLLDDTLEFFLESMALELRKEIDWRARGHGKNAVQRAVIYTCAFFRDLVRIVMHHPAGIGHAQFRFRVAYISNTAIPTLNFFLSEYPLDEKRRSLMEEAVILLMRGASLVNDGPLHVLDEWYATIEEFGQLTKCSREAAKKMEEVIKSGLDSGGSQEARSSASGAEDSERATSSSGSESDGET